MAGAVIAADFGLDHGIGHIRLVEADSEEREVAPPIPKSPQTSTAASARKMYPFTYGDITSCSAGGLTGKLGSPPFETRSGIAMPSSLRWARSTRRRSSAHTAICRPGSSASSAARGASPRRSTCPLSCLDSSSTETNVDNPCALEATRVRHRPRAHGHHCRPAPHCETWSGACQQEPRGHG